MLLLVPIAVRPDAVAAHAEATALSLARVLCTVTLHVADDFRPTLPGRRCCVHLARTIKALSGISKVSADGAAIRYEFAPGTGGMDEPPALCLRMDAVSGALLGANMDPAGVIVMDDLEMHARASRVSTAGPVERRRRGYPRVVRWACCIHC